MEELPHLITDLAYILIVAGAVTIIFKRLHQPLVLGYIVAGFLAGPHMPYMPSISDHDSVDQWSQIGVIFLMFTLGLEFSFKKIVKMGLRPIIAALSVMLFMISVGSLVGLMFGWNNMDRMFLGGMLAMSSTTIIYKAFDDLGLRSRKFASGVLSVLILEDILGILLMVILSAMAVSRQFQGMQLVSSMLQLGFFLILWFLVGIYIVPLILRRNKKYINTETLLIVSVGLCFLLVVIASKVGYSPAFGAFMMGSILAETVEAERIEHTVSSLRDLFGAVFFVSVGMLVDPQVLVQSWLPVVTITLAVILGQMVFGSLSYLIAGNNLKDAIQSGFSMAQIGEFAFIIAALGQSLGVTSDFLYPVVVAVSIITTFFTPYMIRAAEPAYAYLDGILPRRMSTMLDNRSNRSHKALRSEMNVSQAWKTFLGGVIGQTAAYLTLCIAIISVCLGSLLPLFRSVLTHWPGNIVCGIITLCAIAPCIRPIVMRKNHSQQTIFIRQQGSLHTFLFWVVILLKFSIGCNIIYYVLNYLSPFWWVWHVIASIVLMIAIIRNKRVKLLSIRIERTFRQNLESREAQGSTSNPAYGRKLKGKDLHITSLTLPLHSAWGGYSLAQLHVGQKDNVHIAAIIRGSQRINIPGGSNKIYPMDTIEVVGDDESIQAFRQRMEAELIRPDENVPRADRLSLISVSIGVNSPLVGRTLVEADLRGRYHCMVVGIEEAGGALQATQAQRPFRQGDILWVVGEEADLSMLKMGV